MSTGLVLLAIAIPLIVALADRVRKPDPVGLTVLDVSSRFPASRIPFEREALGERVPRPRVTNVQVVDLDGDALPDILACDALRNTIWWYRQATDGGFAPVPLGGTNAFAAPARATVVDLEGDADLDLVVSVLGSVWPTDAPIGGVVLLENVGDGTFEQRRLLDDLRRVTDVQPADFDRDGDVDLVVAEFGYEHGQILWLENRGHGEFRDHPLMTIPGTIHVPVADYDLDGDPDVAAIVTQNEEEVWIFENPGVQGTFHPHARRVWYTLNYDLGGAGLVRSDLDRDGDEDLLLVAGDNLELVYPCPQPYHGCLWLENRGRLEFECHRVATLGGAYSADTADLDADGDSDVVLSSMFNDWRRPGAASLIWLENDGRQRFTPWQIDETPTHLCTVACGDVNRDGRPDVVGGSLLTYEPFLHSIGTAVWFNRSSGREPPE